MHVVKLGEGGWVHSQAVGFHGLPHWIVQQSKHEQCWSLAPLLFVC
jgi:hypothetical protein